MEIKKEIKQGYLTGERALFGSRYLRVIDTIFDDGESPLKESHDIELMGSMFKWKYPLWYCQNQRDADQECPQQCGGVQDGGASGFRQFHQDRDSGNHVAHHCQRDRRDQGHPGERPEAAGRGPEASGCHQTGIQQDVSYA